MRRGVPALALVALALRLGFVAWGVNPGAADGLAYHVLAVSLAAGQGYTNLDGSPAVDWVPGWPAVMAALYTVFGEHPLAPMLANALFGALAVALLALLGRELFGPRTGLLAGGLYAVWPGVVYYSATLHTEPLFTLLLVAFLLCLVRGAGAGRARPAWLAGAGGLLGLCALVKAEPLALPPLVALYLWRARLPARQVAAGTLLVAGLAAAVVAPWVVRNHRLTGRLLLSANSGVTVYNCNHPGSRGRPDVVVSRRFFEAHRRDTHFATSLATIEPGWREARRFVCEHPGPALRLAARKLRFTYESDAGAVRLLRSGFGRSEGAQATGWPWRMERPTWRLLTRVADTWWLAVLALAAVGLSRLPNGPPGAGVLLLGVVALWLSTHVVFCGAPRYHVPETPSLALLAACGAERLRAGAQLAMSSRRRLPMRSA